MSSILMKVLFVFGCCTIARCCDQQAIGAMVDNYGVGIKYGGIVPDSQLTSTTHWITSWGSNQAWRARHARLNKNRGTGGSEGGWCMNWSELQTNTAYLQVDLVQAQLIKAIVTQGQGYICYTNTFKISYGFFENQMLFIQENGSDKIFTRVGADTSNDYILNIFPYAVYARYIRIHPLTWNTYNHIRIELLSDTTTC